MGGLDPHWEGLDPQLGGLGTLGWVPNQPTRGYLGIPQKPPKMLIFEQKMLVFGAHFGAPRTSPPGSPGDLPAPSKIPSPGPGAPRVQIFRGPMHKPLYLTPSQVSRIGELLNTLGKCSFFGFLSKNHGFLEPKMGSKNHQKTMVFELKIGDFGHIRVYRDMVENRAPNGGFWTPNMGVWDPMGGRIICLGRPTIG